MARIRFETAAASATLMNDLDAAGQVRRIIHNGIDIVLFEGRTGDRISAHFIDSLIPVYEIRQILEANAAQDTATLFLLWADMLLPEHGQTFTADDWMETLFTLYGDCIYGYDQWRGESFLFPVYFRGSGPRRAIEHGVHLPYRQLTLREVRTRSPGFTGTWRVADFGGPTGAAHDPDRLEALSIELAAAYALIAVSPQDSLVDIKRAYRLMARRLHPDLNREPDAHEHMQRLNAAYAAILASRPPTSD
ncbi:MAG: J domain-containing protein [Anaerolineae bacterium]